MPIFNKGEFMINMNPVYMPANKYTDKYFKEVRDRSKRSQNKKEWHTLPTSFSIPLSEYLGISEEVVKEFSEELIQQMHGETIEHQLYKMKERILK